MQAAYNIGGHTISADTIQNTILGCRLPRPGQVVHAIPTFPYRKLKKDKRMAIPFIISLKYLFNMQSIYYVNPIEGLIWKLLLICILL